MSGLSRFDFYPRDWHLDTRELSQGAKGVYIDLLSAMYARGGPLPYDERALCQVTGCATVRSLRPLLAELIDKGKIRLVDGALVNNRTMEEIEAANQKIASGAKGGNAKRPPVQREFEPNSPRTPSETKGDIEKKQQLDLKPPSPSPPIEKNNTPSECTVQDENRSEDQGQDSNSPAVQEKELFKRGKEVLGKNAGGLIKRLLDAKGGNVALARSAIEAASTKQDAREYIGAVVRNGLQAGEADGQPLPRDHPDSPWRQHRADW